MMRKSIGNPLDLPSEESAQEWLDLEHAASVEVTSEHPDHTIEAALVGSGAAGGWQAGTLGEQRIRLSFDVPRRIRRIVFEIDDDTSERTQEIEIKCTDAKDAVHHVARQQWNFSPHGSIHEREDYRVDLPDTVAIELTIRPDIGDETARARLTRLRIG